MSPSARLAAGPSRLRMVAAGLARAGGIAAALALGGGPPRGVQASPTPARVTYATSGTIDAAGVAGPPDVRFVGGAGTTDAGTPFSLGAFEVGPADPGAVTRYDHAPVTISYWTRAVDGTSTAGRDGTPADPMVIHGWLSGTVGGTGPAALSVLFDQGLQPDDPRFYQPRPLPPFPAGSGLGGGGDGRAPGYLSLNGGQSLLALAATGGGMTSVAATLDLAAPVPEPTTLLVLAAGGAGLALARRRRRA